MQADANTAGTMYMVCPYYAEESTEAGSLDPAQAADTHKHVLSSIFLLVAVKPQCILSAHGNDG